MRPKNPPYKKILQTPVSKSIHGYKIIASLTVQLLYHPSFYSLRKLPNAKVTMEILTPVFGW